MTKKTESRVKRERDEIILFLQLFDKCLSLTKTIRAAYHMAEDMRTATGKKRFYKDFISFAKARRIYSLKKVQ